MTIFSELVKLKLTPRQTWELKKLQNGISRIWHSYDYYKKEVIVQFVGSSNNPTLPVFREDIDKELEYINKIINQDAVKIQKETPRRLGVTEVLLDHPAYREAERDAIRKHFKNVHEIKVPIPDLKRINKIYEERYGEQIEDIKGVIRNPRKSGEDKEAVILESGDIEDGTDIRSI